MSEQEKTRGELPRDEGTARPASPKHAPRVLIVDDEEGMRNYLSVVLRKAGFATAEAADGQAGYDMLTRQPFDVVLEDLKMPRLDGVFDEHFAGRYMEMVQWLAFCVQVNFQGFFKGSSSAANGHPSPDEPEAPEAA